MKKSRFTEEQIVAALQLAKSGGAWARSAGSWASPRHRWKAKYGGLGSDDAKRLKQLEDENKRLKKIVADQTLDMQILKEVIAKTW